MLSGSFWLSEVADLPLLGASLARDISVDVAIIGGGFVGLWTAITLKELDPSIRVAILEKERCGYGASGLNGGFVMSWWPKIERLVAVAGREDACWLADQTTANISEMQAFLDAASIDAEFARGGWLWTATSSAHASAWRRVLECARSLGRSDVFVELSSDEVARRTGSPLHLGGIYERENGQVHPAKLARALATFARSRGVLLFEGTNVEAMDRGSQVMLHTPGGVVSAKKVVVASSIWSADAGKLAREVVCVTSAVVATPPIPDRLAEIGWTGGETITDSQTMLNYYRTTRSGRIVYGKGVAHLSYRNRVDASVLSDRPGIAATIRDFRRMYPMLADVPIAYGWSGPIDRTYDGLPIIGTFEDAPNIAYGVGWSGNGVGPSRVGARMLAGLVLERRDRWTSNRFVNRVGRRFPPEPVRYWAGSVIRGAVERKDASEIAGRQANSLDVMLARLAPSGTEDKC